MESSGGAFIDRSFWVHVAVFIKPVLQGGAKRQSFSPVCTIGVKGIWFAKDTRVAVCSVNMVTMNISSKHLACSTFLICGPTDIDLIIAACVGRPAVVRAFICRICIYNIV